MKNQQNGGPGVRRGKEEAPVQKVWEVMELEEEIQREAAFFLHAYGVGSLSLSLSPKDGGMAARGGRRYDPSCIYLGSQH